MSTPKISLCCITGNEEPAVIGFLDSFAGAFDELCLVRAVGSVTPDRTLSLAKEWCRKNGKKCSLGIYENALGETRDWPHVDDFAAARNQAWSMATGDWQLWADLDDLLMPARKDAPGGAELIRLCAGADTHDFFFFTYDLRGQNEKMCVSVCFARALRAG